MPESKPTTIVIFGASGDLTHRKLIPALYHLYVNNNLPHVFRIVGASRSEYSHEGFRAEMKESVEKFEKAIYDSSKWEKFAQNIYYIPADAADIEGMEDVRDFLDEKEDKAEVNRLYYLSVAPFLYEPITSNLGALNMTRESKTAWRRLIVEKPFGVDLPSAIELTNHLHSVLNEKQIYRIDHYLGKETAQNLLFFRFANTIFEPVWNRNYVSNVQITVSESVDVGHRAGYYDKSGVLRDMFQNHLLQLLTLVAMEPPTSFEADALRNEKVKVLRAVKPIMPGDTVRAQYLGYREAKGVAPNSHTPTFAALKLYVNNWRWQGVPFYLRSGKALKDKTSEINIEFKHPPHLMFNLEHGQEFNSNTLSVCIQPDEGIHLSFEAKVPESQQMTRSVNMEFHYDTSFGNGSTPDAYVRLLLDALQGDAALFTRSDEIETAWRIIDPIIHHWEKDNEPHLATYKRNSWGPSEADSLLAWEGHEWRLGCFHEDEE